MFDADPGASQQVPHGAPAAVPGPHPHAAAIAAGDWRLLFQAVVERLAQCQAEPEVSSPGAQAQLRECLAALQKLRDGQAPELRATRPHPNDAKGCGVPHSSPP